MANLVRTNCKLLPRIHQNITWRMLSTKTVENPEEYTAEPQYPPIIDLSYEAKRKRRREAYHEEYKQVGTVEEKLFKLNLPKYYGYKALMFTGENLPYNCLGLVQHATRTELKEGEALPDFYKKNDEIATKFCEALKSDVQDVIGFEYLEQGHQLNAESEEEKERFLASNIVQQLNRLVLTRLGKDVPHLGDAEVDLDPRHEAFWMVGGIESPRYIRKFREGNWYKKYANDPVDRVFQYTGTPYLTVRHNLPLVSMTDVAVDTMTADGVTIPSYTLDPRTLGYHTSYRHGTTIPGFWPGSAQEFGLLSYQGREAFIKRKTRYDAVENQEALHAHGIQANFAWIFGQACYQGFTTYNDLTYPLSGQTVVTNGKDFSFYAYQMNTLLVHHEFALENPRYNQCWATKEAQLFQEVDATGKVIGFNEEVLKNLINFYINAPQKRQHEMKPYLDAACPRVADIEDPLRREWVERKYKHITANRKRHMRIPETYLWEKIYKIDNVTRYFDKKLRPFDHGKNPFMRRLDDHSPIYVPRVLRPGGYGGRRTGKSKEKWEKNYYPLGARGRTKNVPNYPWVPLTT